MQNKNFFLSTIQTHKKNRSTFRWTLRKSETKGRKIYNYIMYMHKRDRQTHREVKRDEREKEQQTE